MIRECPKCKQSLPLTNEYFCKCTRCGEGLNYICKQCIKDYQNSIKDTLKEYQKQYQQVYQTENRAELNAYKAAYTRNRYHNDPEFKAKMLADQKARNARLRKLKKQNDK
jgi:DNA repair ATPase RecN